MRFETWKPGLMPAVVRFWNRAFAGKPNFRPMTAAMFRERVAGRREFDPRGFIVAREGRELAGLIHVGVRRGAKGSTQGYVAIFFVDPACRRKGVGNALWHQGLERLKRARQVVLGFTSNPFYGGGLGPPAPLWGSPRGIGVEWRDGATQKFLARKGFAPRERAVQASLDVAEAPWTDLGAVAAGLSRRGLALEVAGVGRVEPGRRAGPVGPSRRESAVIVDRWKVLAVQTYYPMAEVRAGLFGIQGAEFREGGERKGIARALLLASIERLRVLGARRCETVLLPETDPAGYRMYLDAGFRKAAEWAVY